MITISTGHNEARLGGSLNYLQTGSGTAVVQIYNGARPASGATPAGTMLASIPLDNGIGTIDAGALVLTVPAEGLIVSSGIAAWARIRKRDGGYAMDCDVGQVDSHGTVITPGDLLLDQTTLYEGGVVRLMSGVLG